MPKIVLSEVTESHVLRADGERLRKAIEEIWGVSNDPIEVDFEGESIASASFFDESFGILALRHPLSLLKDRLRPVRLSDSDRALLNLIVTRRAAERTGGAEG